MLRGSICAIQRHFPFLGSTHRSAMIPAYHLNPLFSTPLGLEWHRLSIHADTTLVRHRNAMRDLKWRIAFSANHQSPREGPCNPLPENTNGFYSSLLALLVVAFLWGSYAPVLKLLLSLPRCDHLTCCYVTAVNSCFLRHPFKMPFYLTATLSLYPLCFESSALPTS